MELRKIIDFMTPWSVNYHATSNFKDLKLFQKIEAVGITALATLITLGIGTTPAFRYLVDRLSHHDKKFHIEYNFFKRTEPEQVTESEQVIDIPADLGEEKTVVKGEESEELPAIQKHPNLKLVEDFLAHKDFNLYNSASALLSDDIKILKEEMGKIPSEQVNRPFKKKINGFKNTLIKSIKHFNTSSMSNEQGREVVTAAKNLVEFLKQKGQVQV